MSAGVAHYPDPDIEHGAFRVYPRTTGGYVIVDTRRTPGTRTIADRRGRPYTWKTAKEAGEVAKAWHEQGHG